MAALEFSERVPVPIEQPCENLRFYFALLQRLIALSVARVILAIRIDCRHEHDVFPVRRPDAAVRTSRKIRQLMRLADERACVWVEIAHPDLRRISRFRSPDQPFAVGRKSRPLFMIRRWI